MRITYLGHAGFCVETSAATIIMDPWMSPTGAFDASWFQFPRNHHLGPFVEARLREPGKARLVYISHEHKDHFDLDFLRSLKARGFTLLIGGFKRGALKSALSSYACLGLVVLGDQQQIPIPGGSVTLFLDDAGLNRDSAILVKADGQAFLNINDCKLYDRLADIVLAEGRVDVFACQFSGATWHPICYGYPRPEYERLVRTKVLSKFESVAQAIATVQPRVYLPSAGPPCFLDPDLLHFNFDPVTIFPRAPQLLGYLKRRLPGYATRLAEVAPGDVLDAALGIFVARGQERVSEQQFEPYIKQYAADYRDLFAAMQAEATSPEGYDDLLERLRAELLRKLGRLRLRERISGSLFFGFTVLPGRVLEVDFRRGTVEHVLGHVLPKTYYRILAPSWQIRRNLNGELTWEDIALSFRARLKREPDVYQTILQAFLILEAEDLDWFCTRLIEFEERGERTVITVGGRRYSINRFCPHQGGDLRNGRPGEGASWTCPRHGWQFDLENGGRCMSNDRSIEAVALDDDDLLPC